MQSLPTPDLIWSSLHASLPPSLPPSLRPASAPVSALLLYAIVASSTFLLTLSLPTTYNLQSVEGGSNPGAQSNGERGSSSLESLASRR